MTTANMLSRINTIVDEVSESTPMWSPTEKYEALADGQNALVNHLVMVWSRLNRDGGVDLFETLQPLLTDTGFVNGDDSADYDLPAGFIRELSVTKKLSASVVKPCRKRRYDGNRVFRQANQFLVGDGSNSFFYTIVNDEIVFDSAVAVGEQYQMLYLSRPPQIASGQEPTLQEGHEEIVHYAVAQLFKKDRLMELSVQMYGKYIQGIQNLYF